MRCFGTFPVGGTLLGFVLLASLIGAVQPTAAQCIDLQGCALVWSDEFDGT